MGYLNNFGKKFEPGFSSSFTFFPYLETIGIGEGKSRIVKNLIVMKSGKPNDSSKMSAGSASWAFLPLPAAAVKGNGGFQSPVVAEVL
jgi:hypothetical protein